MYFVCKLLPLSFSFIHAAQKKFFGVGGRAAKSVSAENDGRPQGDAVRAHRDMQIHLFSAEQDPLPQLRRIAIMGHRPARFFRKQNPLRRICRKAFSQAPPRSRPHRERTPRFPPLSGTNPPGRAPPLFPPGRTPNTDTRRFRLPRGRRKNAAPKRTPPQRARRAAPPPFSKTLYPEKNRHEKSSRKCLRKDY